MTQLLERSITTPALGDWLRALDEQEVEALLDRLGQLPVQRLPITAQLLAAGWAMRDNVSVRDALYVAAAQAAGALLVTTDGRLARPVSNLAADVG